MRLLVVTHYFPEHRGGIEIVAGELARRLALRGIEIRWAASAGNRSPDSENSTIPKLTRVPMRVWNVAENHFGFPYPLWSLGGLRTLRELVSWADVIHLHDSLYFGNFLAFQSARRLRKPIVVTQHIGEVPYKNPILRGMLAIANRTIARRVLGGANRCVFISPRVRDYFGDFVRFRLKPLDLPNGVDTKIYSAASEEGRRDLRRRMGWPADSPILLFVGRFVEKKGLLTLREVARQLPECTFVFAGWGPLDPRQWGLPNVSCSGSLGSAKLAEHYRAADLLVLPSLGEGFPLVVQEAAACGTPSLISCETGRGMKGIDAFTYSSESDAESIVRELRTILRHPNELAARREFAANFALQNWDWNRCADEYAAIFAELAS